MDVNGTPPVIIRHGMGSCSRCGAPFKAGDRRESDPCCSAPDCEAINDVSHYGCLPPALKKIADEEAMYTNWGDHA
jgi:hypothetical protein